MLATCKIAINVKKIQLKYLQLEIKEIRSESEGNISLMCMFI